MRVFSFSVSTGSSLGCGSFCALNSGTRFFYGPSFFGCSRTLTGVEKSESASSWRLTSLAPEGGVSGRGHKVARLHGARVARTYAIKWSLQDGEGPGTKARVGTARPAPHTARGRETRHRPISRPDARCV